MKDESSRKNQMRKNVSTLLIIIGLSIIAIPIIGKIIVNKRQDELLQGFYLDIDNQALQVEDSSGEELETVLQWGTEEENQQELSDNMDNIQQNQLQDSKALKTMPKAIGVITIDKIDVKLPIAEGVDLETLRFAVGHMPGTAALGTIGNSVLAGHRSHTFGAFFNRLDELEVGDEIEIKNSSGDVVIYEVYEKILVEPDDLSVLNGTNENKVLTLITCHPEINPTSRLIIHAISKE